MMENGLAAGLTSHASLKEQNAAIRDARSRQQQEQEQGKAPEDVVFRDRHGRRLDGVEDYLKKQEDLLEQQKQQQFEWGSGVKQRREQEERRQRLEEEKTKPFAQYADDKEIDAATRQRTRWGDPAAAFKSRKGTTEAAASGDGESRPRYKGPPAPPNRFGIEPDYLWDGVDRSNGFEKKLYAMEASKAAKEERRYFWSVADM